MTLSMLLALNSVFKTPSSVIWKVNHVFSYEFRKKKFKIFSTYIGQKILLRERGILLRRQFMGSVCTFNLPICVSFLSLRQNTWGKKNLKDFLFGSQF